MGIYYAEVVRKVIEPVLVDYARDNGLSIKDRKMTRDITVVDDKGENLADISFEHKTIRAPMVSDVKVCVEPCFFRNQQLHPNVRLNTRSFTVKNGEDHGVIAKKIVRFVEKLVSDYNKASKDSQSITESIETAKSNRAMAIKDALRNHPEMDYDESIEQVRYKNFRLTPSLRNDEVLFEVKLGAAQTKFVNADVIKMIVG